MSTGKLLIIIGLATALLGAALLRAPWLLSWFGNLPGDIRIERDGLSIRFPLTSMLLASLILTVLLNVARRLW